MVMYFWDLQIDPEKFVCVWK